MNSIFEKKILVTPGVVDGNRHVNNVVYIQWLQDTAIDHADSSGCMAATAAAGATWVVRSHFIEYLAPAFVDDVLAIQTWVVNFQKVRSLRRYKIVRPADDTVIARAETDWVFVNALTGRPQAIPADVKATLPVAGKEKES